MQRNIDNLTHIIDDLQNKLSLMYGRITPVQREKSKIDISNLKIQRANLIINQVRNNMSSSDPISALEIEKQLLLIQFYQKEIQQSQIRLRTL